MRHILTRIVRSLRAIAGGQYRSIEPKRYALIEGHGSKRRATLEEIARGWSQQTRRPSAEEIDSWIHVGRR